MRTWKQGALGKAALSASKALYVKLLKYPLAELFDDSCLENRASSKALCAVFIDLSCLREIEEVGFEKLTEEEKKLSARFAAEYVPGTATIKRISPAETADGAAELDYGKLCSLDDLKMRYAAAKTIR